MEKLYVIKIGGNIIDDEVALATFLEAFSKNKAHKILVHGGGKLATRVAGSLGILQQMVDGRRITDAETLKVISMVYGGYINKNIVAKLQAFQCNAIGLTGADADIIQAHKRVNSVIDYGFVGDVDGINTPMLTQFLQAGLTPVFAPLTHDNNGCLLNTNADTIAQEIAKAMSASFETTLIYCFEKEAVLADADNNNSVISRIYPRLLMQLKADKIISDGMIPKLDNAFAALEAGVQHIVIGHAKNLNELILHQSGTAIVHE